MSKFTCQTPSSSGDLMLNDEPLGRGGEGSVFSIKSHALSTLPASEKLVAKIYHDSSDKQRTKKIIAMVKNPPDTDSVAWPLGLVVDSNNAVVGYVMEKLASDTYRMWAELAHTQQRRQSAGSFDVRYALTSILNFALALSSIHETNAYVGDINESNIFISNDARVLLVDTDSAQISFNGKIYPCLVGKPEYTAAELSHGPLKNQLRTEESDMFGFAVAAYQLLLGGPHPTDGIFEGDDDPPSTVEKIRAGTMPNLKMGKGLKPVPRVASDGVPTRLKPLFVRAFSPDPTKRPKLEEFEDTLDDILNNLTRCSKIKQHWYDKRDKKCGWCAHAKKGQPDPWDLKPPTPKNKKNSSQRTLKPIYFKEEKKNANQKAPRRSVNATQAGVQRQAAASTSNKSPSNQSGATKIRSSGSGQPLSNFYMSNRIDMTKSRGKTLLQYADGTSRPRPELPTLLFQKPKLAYQCFVNELPNSIRISWPMKEKIPSNIGLIIGMVLALVIAGSWYFLIPQLVGYLPNFPMNKIIFAYFTLASVATSAIGPLLKLITTFFELSRAKKVVGTFDDIAQESPITTSLSMVISSIMYGPFFIIGMLFILLSLIFSFFSEVGKQSK